VAFYASPPEFDRKCFTLDSTGISLMRPVPVRFRRDHGWRSYQFMYTMRGEGIGDIEGTEFHAYPHSVTLMPPDKSHGYQPAPGCKMWEYRWIEFSGGMAADLLKMLGLFGRSHIHHCREAWPAVEQVVATLESGGNAALHEAGALFLRVLSLVEWNVRPERTRFPIVQPLDHAAKRFIADHLEAEITLRDIARAIRTSPHHLIRVFKRHNRMTPMAYLRQLRAEHARQLLARGDLSIKEVGQRIGYPVLQHFSRMFRVETGQSPRAFLRSRSKAEQEN
jgi:AraC-like DNA-binding protein